MSNADVDTARATAASANATRASLGARSGSLTLLSPVGGTVQGMTVRPGDVVAAGTSIATIAATGQVRARFGVDPASAQRIRAGQKLRIATNNNETAIESSVTGVDTVIDPATRQASVYAALPAGFAFAPGETLRATVDVGGRRRERRSPIRLCSMMAANPMSLSWWKALPVNAM
jgi:multidrug resistance efflux pump